MDYLLTAQIPITNVPDNISAQEARVTAEVWLRNKIPDAKAIDFREVVNNHRPIYCSTIGRRTMKKIEELQHRYYRLNRHWYGRLWLKWRRWYNLKQVWEKCPSTSCKDGLVVMYDGSTNQDYKCLICKGTGKVRIQFKLPEGIEQSIKDALFDNGVSNRGHITRQILSLIRQDNGGKK